MRLIFLLASTAWGQPPPDKQDLLTELAKRHNDFIVQGEVTSEHPAVGALVAVNGTEMYFYCSANLIHPKWVLSAAHCQELTQEISNTGYNTYFVTGNAIEDYNEKKAIVYHKRHPEYSETPYITHDLAVLQLESVITSVDPLVRNTVSPDENLWTDIKFVGWGVTGDEQLDDGVKRHTTIPYDGHDESYLYAHDPNGNNICFGDSGGAALIQNNDRQWLLVGVNSFVYDPQGGDPTCIGGAAAAVRVDAYKTWIDNQLTTADGGAAPGNQNTSNPKPLTDEEASGCSQAPHLLSWSVTWCAAGLLVGRRRNPPKYRN